MEKHGNQVRKDGELYFNHPQRVAKKIESLSASKYENSILAVASLLHDVVEDTDATLDEVKTLFGNEVAKLVDELTDKFVPEEGTNRKERKRKEADRLSKASLEAQIIKLADIADNLSTFPVLTKKDAEFALIYVEEKLYFIDQISATRDFRIQLLIKGVLLAATFVITCVIVLEFEDG